MNGITDSNIGHCRQCGKLIPPGMQEGLCSMCREAELLQAMHGEETVTRVRKTLDQLADTVGLTSHEVRQAMREMPTLAQFLDNEPTCANCGRRPPIEGMPLCLWCQIDALDMLRTAAGEAYEHAQEEREEQAEHQHRSVMEVLEEKRARTSTANINPSGAQKVKNYRYN